MPHLHQGRLIRARIFDPHGGNPKVRPLLVISPTVDLARASSVVGVAVTGEFNEPPDWDEVLLPWQRDGKGRSQLSKACVAKCSWQREVSIADIVDYKGTVPQAEMEAIIAIVKKIDDDSEPDACG